MQLLAQDVSAQKEQKKRLEEEISFIDNQLKGIVSQQKATDEQLALIRRKADNRKALVKMADRTIDSIQREINAKNLKINTLQSKLDTLERHYSSLVYNAYKNRDDKVWFMYVLASENIGQGFRRFSYLKNMSQAVSGQAESIRQTKDSIESQKELLSKMMAEAGAAKEAREKEYKLILEEERKAKGVANKLAKNKSEFTKQLAKKRQQVNKLNKEIERLVGATVKQQQKNSEKIDYTLAGKFEQNKGKLPWPVQGVVTAPFGKHRHPVYKNIELPQNNGIDITTSKMAQVKCVFDGEVRQILLMPGYNQCVLVQHGTYFSFYCHLGKVTVRSGQKVKTGEVLGMLEEGGSVLHFQIWNGTEKQNPAFWLR